MKSVDHGGVDHARMIANASATLSHTSELSIMSYVSPIMICYGRSIALIGLGLVLVYVQCIVRI
jgi:hypothetical protein